MGFAAREFGGDFLGVDAESRENRLKSTNRTRAIENRDKTTVLDVCPGKSKRLIVRRLWIHPPNSESGSETGVNSDIVRYLGLTEGR